jgi:hypothetical protein
MHAIAVASKLYDFIIDSQMFGNTHDEYTGFSILVSNREDQYPFDGHHRFAWFVMNYILVKNNVPPVYFTANEVKRDNDHLHAEIILTRAPKQRYDFMQESA